jgi:hypothetical protein
MMPEKPTTQEAWQGEHRWVNLDNEDQMDEVNVIFEGSLSITSKTHRKKLEREISLARCIEPERRMKWSETNIMFGPEDHPEIELSNQNLPFVVKLPIGRHKVAKTFIDNGASLNLIMRKTFIKMSLNLVDLTPVHNTFHGVILSSHPLPSDASTWKYPAHRVTISAGRC